MNGLDLMWVALAVAPAVIVGLVVAYGRQPPRRLRVRVRYTQASGSIEPPPDKKDRIQFVSNRPKDPPTT